MPDLHFAPKRFPGQIADLRIAKGPRCDSRRCKRSRVHAYRPVTGFSFDTAARTGRQCPAEIRCAMVKFSGALPDAYGEGDCSPLLKYQVSGSGDAGPGIMMTVAWLS
jgi:hypothetical protein